MNTKTIIFCLALFSVACQEEEVKPDPILGNWSYKSGDLEFSFDFIREYVYKGVNSRVEHPALDQTEYMDNYVVTYNYTGSGFREIKIVANRYTEGADPEFYRVQLIEAVVNGEEMSVEEIRVLMPGMEEFIIEDQTLSKNSR